MTKPCRSAQTPQQEPKESGATIRWREMVEAEHAQSDRMRQELPPEDHWQPYAQQFRADPSRADDPLLTRLLETVGSHHTVMDVGAGGGRLALPLALRCKPRGGRRALAQYGLRSARAGKGLRHPKRVPGTGALGGGGGGGGGT